MGYKVSEVEGRNIPSKKHINLKNISVADLHFVDVDTNTGETNDITSNVLKEIPENIKTVNFKITVELINEDESEEN